MPSYEVRLAGGRTVRVELERSGTGWQAKVEGRPYALELVGGDGVRNLVVRIDGESVELDLEPLQQSVEVHEVPPLAPPARGTAAAGGPLHSPITGVVLAVHAQPGATVQEGDALVVIEAMKMENTIRAPAAAEVGTVNVRPGDKVRRGDVLLELTATRGKTN
jgi:biotin carboxyl carrier protein